MLILTDQATALNKCRGDDHVEETVDVFAHHRVGGDAAPPHCVLRAEGWGGHGAGYVVATG